MEEDDWLSAKAPAEPEAAPEAEAPPAAPAEAAEEEEECEEEEEEDEEDTRKPRDKAERRMLYRVWKRPVFLQYAYLYDYRHNYYDDVIDYLDRRQRGIYRDPPRAQTWAERALRTYTNQVKQTDAYKKKEKDIHLLSNIRTSSRFYTYHMKDYFNTTKYSNVLL